LGDKPWNKPATFATELWQHTAFTLAVQGLFQPQKPPFDLAFDNGANKSDSLTASLGRKCNTSNKCEMRGLTPSADSLVALLKSNPGF